MVRTLNTLRFIVIGMALALAVLATPAANAQSVKGSGHPTNWFSLAYQFKVNAYAKNNGAFGGSIQLTTYGNSTTKEAYSVESLSVTGNYAMIWARAKSDQTLHAFYFIDNWDGSGSDLFAWDGYADGLEWLEFLYGDVTVTP